MNTSSSVRSDSARQLAEQVLSRAAGAPLLGGNVLELMIDGAVHFEAWLSAIRGARQRVLLENYIIRDDPVGRAFRDALAERARAGVLVAVIGDWLGCFGQSGRRFWKPLRDAGARVLIFNAPRLGYPLGWISRDHRKQLVVDGTQGFLSGVCISAKWLGEPARGIAPWRDTGVALRGPAVAELERAFAQIWQHGGGAPLPLENRADANPTAGTTALRVIATQPATAGMYRLDQLIASMARETLWLTDAYFVGVAPYTQALAAAARDGVDVRLLVPGISDIPVVASLSRAGYRSLLEAGIRVFEWNGSMMHAKTAVADGRWARVGSSNLNLASWLNNHEIDIAVEDHGFAAQLAAQYERDLAQATEIVLAPSRWHRGARVRASEPRSGHRKASGSSGRAATSALRIANSMSTVFTGRRVLAADPPILSLAGSLLGLAVLAVVALLWPRWIAWPIGLLCAWFALNLAVQWWRVRRDASRRRRRSI